MRKVGTEKELEVKKKRTTIYISLFMLGVLVISTIGFSFVSNLGTDDNQPTTNEQVAGKSNVDFEGQTFYLTNSLEESKNVSVEITATLDDYVGKTIYVSSKNSGVTMELFQLFSKYSARIQEACYGSCDEDLPERDCSENLIVWKDSAENKVYQEDKCIFIEGDLRAVDGFIYQLMGKR